MSLLLEVGEYTGNKLSIPVEKSMGVSSQPWLKVPIGPRIVLFTLEETGWCALSGNVKVGRPHLRNKYDNIELHTRCKN